MNSKMEEVYIEHVNAIICRDFFQSTQTSHNFLSGEIRDHCSDSKICWSVTITKERFRARQNKKAATH